MFEAKDHDAVATAVAGRELFRIEKLSAVAGLVGIAHEVEEPHQFDGAFGDGERGIGDLGLDFGECLHGVEFGVGFLKVGGPGSDRGNVVFFEGEAGRFGTEDGEVGIVAVGTIVGVFDRLRV